MAASWRSCPLVMLGVLALHVSTCTGNYEHTCTLNTRMRGPHRMGICGRRLPELISTLCGSGLRGKREASKQLDPDALDNHLKGIILGKKQALSYLHSRLSRSSSSYGSQGITCECCYNSCNISELLEYCN